MPAALTTPSFGRKPSWQRLKSTAVTAAAAGTAAAVVTEVTAVLAVQEVCLHRREAAIAALAAAAAAAAAVTVVRRTVLAIPRIVEVDSQAMELHVGIGREKGMDKGKHSQKRLSRPPWEFSPQGCLRHTLVVFLCASLLIQALRGLCQKLNTCL